MNRHVPKREFLYFSGIVLPFFLITALIYGAPLPGTISAKLAQKESGLWRGFLQGLLIWIHDFTYLGPMPFIPTLPPGVRFCLYALAGGITLLTRYRFWILPIIWMTLFFALFTLFNVPFYHWYYVPIIAGLIILGASAITSVEVVWKKRIAVVRALILLALLPGLYTQILNSLRMENEYGGEVLYQKAGLWLRSNTPQDATVGYFEIGLIGYYSDRKIIDPLGLVSSGVASHVRKRDLIWAYAYYKPDYIIYNERFSGWFSRMLDEDWFRSEYQMVAEIPHRGWSPLRIYRRTNLPLKRQPQTGRLFGQ
jgi:hypothetical protein